MSEASLPAPWRWFAYPLNWIITLKRHNYTSLFAVAMLGGIMALSLFDLYLIWKGGETIHKGDNYMPLFGMIQMKMQYNSILQGWFAFILGLIVFGANRASGKIAGAEISVERAEEED